MKLSRFYLLFVPLLVLTLFAGIALGSTALAHTEQAMLILRYVRLPRVASGVLAGIGLSVSGVLLQSVTANELASPNIIGINAGAGLAVIVLLSTLPQFSMLVPFGAFLGALCTAMLILLICDRFGSSRSVIVLIGIAVTTVLNAVISFFSLLDEGILSEYNHFTVGSLKGLQLGDLALPAILIALCFVCSMGLAGRLHVLCLGDSAASALGVQVRAVRVMALVLAAASSAAVVSFAGLLGFVGLIVPHIARAQVGQDPRKALPASAILGAIIVVLADLLGRTLFAPSELPVGIVMSLIGAPYFFILLVRRKRHAHM